MKTPTRIEARLTHSYVGSCAHLDKWGSICNARVTAPRLVKAPGDDASDGATRAFVVSLTAADLATARESYRRLRFQAPHRHGVPLSFARWMNRSIEQNYTSAGCHHEYDCCGCASTYADAHRTKRGEFTVTVRTSYNY